MAQVLSTGWQRAAKLSRVQVLAQFLAYASWEANMLLADLPTVNFESYNATDDATYAEGIGGVIGSDFKFGGAWDSNQKPFGTIPGLYPRDNAGPINLIPSRAGTGGGDGVQWNYPLARIRGVGTSGTVEGLVLFNVTDAKSQGRFTYP